MEWIGVAVVGLTMAVSLLLLAMHWFTDVAAGDADRHRTTRGREHSGSCPRGTETKCRVGHRGTRRRRVLTALQGLPSFCFAGEGDAHCRPRRELDLISKPRLSIGLPVYNGADFLAQSLDSLLGQTFEDFELIISSNASTDGTDDICSAYAARDPRVQFFRQSTNIGAVPNHYFVFGQATGELFKWASGDDLYARDLLARCIERLDQHPEAVLAHSWTAAVDGTGTLIQAHEYPLATDSPVAAERLRSLLFEVTTCLAPSVATTSTV